MRVPIRVNEPALLIFSRALMPLRLQVVTAGATVFFSPNRADLERGDTAGTPTAGFSLADTNGVMEFDNFSGELWARSATLAEVEVQG